jgi:hypothetical protein
MEENKNLGLCEFTDHSDTPIEPEKILTAYVRDTETGKIVGVEYVDFKPGTIIKRCGIPYMLMENGSQRRLHDPRTAKGKKQLEQLNKIFKK